MVEWLLTPLDASRAHDVGFAIAWHGRMMVLAWGFLFPLGILIARYFKVLPGQDWPRVRDNKTWWHAHLAFHSAGAAVVVLAMALILFQEARMWRITVHTLLGWGIIAALAGQFLLGWLRGSKGGPTEPNVRGDHYDMTLRRRLFEAAHKSLGYAALLASVAAILTGLWQANAPRWMAITLIIWWMTLLTLAILLQRRGFQVDTYQAIWGPGEEHPGNRNRIMEP